MLYFVDTLKEVMKENDIASFRDLSEKVGIPVNTLYGLTRFNPSTKNALKIVDYFSSSLDYFERKSYVFKCKFNKDYKINFFPTLRKELFNQHITVSKFCKDLSFSETSFDRWRSGVIPEYQNLVEIATYLDLSIDFLIGRNYEEVK